MGGDRSAPGFGVVSLLTMGVFLLAIAIVLIVVGGLWAPLRDRAAIALVGGLAAAPLYLAWLNRDRAPVRSARRSRTSPSARIGGARGRSLPSPSCSSPSASSRRSAHTASGDDSGVQFRQPGSWAAMTRKVPSRAPARYSRPRQRPRGLRNGVRLFPPGPSREPATLQLVASAGSRGRVSRYRCRFLRTRSWMRTGEPAKPNSSRSRRSKNLR